MNSTFFNTFVGVFFIASTAIGQTITPPETPSIELLSEIDDREGNSSNCSVDRKQSLLNRSSLLGFGANTTGGVDSVEYTVISNTNDDGPGSLRQALTSSGPRWIIFDPSLDGKTIYLRTTINVRHPNVTIDGRDARVTISPAQEPFLLFTFRGGNSIINGLTIDGLGMNGTALMLREGDNYWVDHVTITNLSGDDSISLGQGNKQQTSADLITISNYRAYNTSKGIQAGGNGNYPDHPLLHTTIYSSELAASERNPRFQYGVRAHVFNSFIHSFTSSGMDAGRTAQIISENNVISADTAKNPNSSQIGWYSSGQTYANESHRPEGHIYTFNDLLINNAASSGSINPSEPAPFVIDYEYKPIDSNLVQDHVVKNAGALNNDNSLEYCE